MRCSARSAWPRPERIFDRLPQVGDGFHLEFFVQQLDALGAEAGNAQQVEETGREFLDERLALRHVAGGDQRFDLARDPFADAGKLGEVVAAGAHQLGERIRMVAHRARRVAVRAHFERIPVRDFEEVRNLVELSCDVGVLHRPER